MMIINVRIIGISLSLGTSAISFLVCSVCLMCGLNIGAISMSTIDLSEDIVIVVFVIVANQPSYSFLYYYLYL